METGYRGSAEPRASRDYADDLAPISWASLYSRPNRSADAARSQRPNDDWADESADFNRRESVETYSVRNQRSRRTSAEDGASDSARGKGSARADRRERESRIARAISQARQVRDARAARTTRETRDADEAGPETPAKVSKREARRRERKKARADKLFNKQFAGKGKGANAAASAEPAEGAPRAAIYEGKVGSTQRRSARMQRSTMAESATARINPLSWLSALNLNITARSLRVATAAVCMLLVCAFLYVPAQQYYQAQRERDRLAAEYAYVEQRNQTLDLQNDVLASDAGMEDAVRAKYGYVKAGEEVGVVVGLSEHATDTSRDNEGLEPAILSSSVKAPEEWYTPFLDAFFGVK